MVRTPGLEPGLRGWEPRIITARSRALEMPDLPSSHEYWGTEISHVETLVSTA